MKIIRIYTGADNESHFEEKEIDLKFSGDMEVSALQPAEGILFRRAPTTHNNSYHPAPKRQYVITLTGQVEIETGDGTVKRFGPGDVMLADDTTGHGHITRVVGMSPARHDPAEVRNCHRQSDSPFLPAGPFDHLYRSVLQPHAVDDGGDARNRIT
jgi:hypothetical protein